MTRLTQRTYHLPECNIWRMDEQGGDLKQITWGDIETPAMCSPDGKWLMFEGSVENKNIAERFQPSRSFFGDQWKSIKRSGPNGLTSSS